MRTAIIFIALLLLGTHAHAWQLQTKLATTGGWLQVRNEPVQTVAGLVVYHNYTTHAAVTARVRSNSGFLISKFQRGTVVTNLAKTTALDVDYYLSGGSVQSLIPTFATAPAATASVNSDPSGVSVIPAVTVSTWQAHSVQFQLMPLSGWSVTGVSVPNGAYISLQDKNTLEELPLSGVYTQPLLLNLIAESGANTISVTTQQVVTPPSEDEDVTEPQMTAFFTNMSTQSAKVIASNADLAHVVKWGCSALFGGLMAVLFGTSWKG